MKRLATYQIGTRPFFWPMHEQPIFEKMGYFANESYPHSEHIARRGFYLPSGLAITEEQIVQVVSAVKNVLREVN
ncbi:putative pyridoxal phosphate-dependent aminotransferase EpsN [compost metagenome]